MGPLSMYEVTTTVTTKKDEVIPTEQRVLFTLDSPKLLVELLSERINEMEVEGYEPTHVIMWEPWSYYFRKQMAEFLKDDDFDLRKYIDDNFGLKLNVIIMDEREDDWLKKLDCFVYHEQERSE